MLYHALHRATMDSLYTKDWKNKDLWEKYVYSLELRVMLCTNV